MGSFVATPDYGKRTTASRNNKKARCSRTGPECPIRTSYYSGGNAFCRSCWNWAGNQ